MRQLRVSRSAGLERVEQQEEEEEDGGRTDGGEPAED